MDKLNYGTPRVNPWSHLDIRLSILRSPPSAVVLLRRMDRFLRRRTKYLDSRVAWMRLNSKTGKHQIAKALLGIYQAKHIERKDQLLFQRTLVDLKREIDSAIEEEVVNNHDPKTDSSSKP